MVAKLSARIPRRLRPDDYPVHLEGDIHGLSVRPIVPADLATLRSEFESADAETLRMRFFVPSPHLSDTDFERLTNVDYRRRLALTVWDGKRPVAIARYEPVDDTTAEVAFVVKKNHRNRGIGRGLIEMLATAAADNGFETLVAVYLVENSAAAASLAAAGFSERSVGDGMVEAVREL